MIVQGNSCIETRNRLDRRCRVIRGQRRPRLRILLNRLDDFEDADVVVVKFSCELLLEAVELLASEDVLGREVYSEAAHTASRCSGEILTLPLRSSMNLLVRDMITTIWLC